MVSFAVHNTVTFRLCNAGLKLCFECLSPQPTVLTPFYYHTPYNSLTANFYFIDFFEVVTDGFGTLQSLLLGPIKFKRDRPLLMFKGSLYPHNWCLLQTQN